MIRTSLTLSAARIARARLIASGLGHSSEVHEGASGSAHLNGHSNSRVEDERGGVSSGHDDLRAVGFELQGHAVTGTVHRPGKACELDPYDGVVLGSDLPEPRGGVGVRNPRCHSGDHIPELQIAHGHDANRGPTSATLGLDLARRTDDPQREQNRAGDREAPTQWLHQFPV